MAYPKQTWDTSSYVNPTRMNHIEDGIKSAVDGLTNIYIEGSTNNTGSTISMDTYFYLNGTLVKAITAIASGATFTLNTNYEVVSEGGLNDLPTQWQKSVTGVTASNAVTLSKPDGTNMTTYNGLIMLQTATSQVATASMYVIRTTGYITPIAEGTSGRAPRLIYEDGVYKVKLSSDTTARSVTYVVWKFES